MRRSGLSLAQQAFALHARFPDAKVRLNATQLLWSAVLQPTPLSREYRVQISYQLRRYPQVRVLDALATRGEASLPHVFSNGTLCLHRDGEWTSRMSIVDSTVPWASEWLAHYEVWLATGDWHGGGVWPPHRVVPELDSEAGDAEAGKEAPVTLGSADESSSADWQARGDQRRRPR